MIIIDKTIQSSLPPKNKKVLWDAGIGVGKYIPNKGGEGHITTAEGVNVHYTFNTDGSIVKEKEIDVNFLLADLDGRLANLETK